MEIAVELESLAPGGDAVGRQVGGEHDGRVTFVPLGAPGERVRARVTRQKSRVAWAELVVVERRGPDRVGAACPLFGACGGCQWQHVTRAAQLDAKRAIVERALGVAPAAIIVASPDYGYRERAKLTVGRKGEVGFRARRSHEVIDVAACPLLGQQLGAELPAVRAAAAGLPPGTVIHLQAGAEGVAVTVEGGVRRGPTEVDIAEPGSPALRIPAGAFAQVGRAGNEALVRAVMDAVGARPGCVHELHAGSGNFTRHLQATASDLHASDAEAGAVVRGRRNAPRAHWGSRPPEGPLPDVVVLDPPREGADVATLACAVRARRRIVYISCDPQTLARDARTIVSAGFHLTHSVALDLMPQTFHVEVVAVFAR